MTYDDRLREFLVNPFGEERKARELLCAIENRPISDAEFERGLFCFQIAFYFLASRAITARIDDQLLQEISTQQLHDQMRRFYSGTASRLNCFDLVVAPDERDQFVATLISQIADADETGNEPSLLTATKLSVFDFFSIRRLCEYRDAVDQPNHLHQFYRVAEQVLFHYSAKRFPPFSVVVIADLLSDSYNIVCQIVASDFLVFEPSLEHEDAFVKMPFSPSMPDVACKLPKMVYSADGHVVLLFEDVDQIGGVTNIRFRYVLAVSDRRSKLPMCFVTLENSFSVANVLGVFEQNGSHSNYGSLRGQNVLDEFLGRGMDLIRERFDLGEIEELNHQRQRSWRKSLSMRTQRRHPQRLIDPFTAPCVGRQH